MSKREIIYNKTCGKCIYCGCDLEFNNFHIEHVVPKSKLKSNKNNINNLFPACIDCNLIKGNLDVEEFRKKIENLMYYDTRCRIIKKYYNVEQKKIKFYFEGNQYGT